MWMSISDLFITTAYYCALFFVPFIGYILFFEENKNRGVRYKMPDWYYLIKKRLAISTIKELKRKCKESEEALDWETQEQPKKLSTNKQTDTQILHGLDHEGNSIFIKLILRQHRIAELILCLKLSDGQTYRLPNEPEVLLCSIQARQWKAEGLSVTVLEPFRRLRIVYNGLLRNVNHPNAGDEASARVQHVKFNFIWNTSDKPLRYPQDVPDSLLSDALAREPWRDGDWIDLIGDERGYEQFGALQGVVSGEAFPQDKILYFPCLRQRYWGTAQSHGLHRDFSAFIVTEDGTLINVGAKSYKKGCAQVRYGTVLRSMGLISPIEDHDVDIECVGENSAPETLTIHLTVNTPKMSKTFKCILHLNHDKATTTHSDALKGWILKLVPAECVVDGQKAQAMITFWYPKHGKGVGLPDPLLTEPKLDIPTSSYVVPFSAREAKITALAGGKGSSLGLLASVTTKNFVVPEGFVIVSTAFSRHLQQNSQLQEAVNELEAISRGNIQADLSKACQRVTDLFASTSVDQEVAQAILNELNAVRGDSGGTNTTWKWAVRSSGLSEDSEELSAAGQNATFLGCSSEKDVLKAVAACWGSLFAFQSVQYRRQHGLDVNCGMGVVVQRMVPSETAGVLFTCHPTSGNPSQLMITANYGLGESVVSGHAEPDTIVLTRTLKNDLSITCKDIGSKKISMVMSDSAATITKDVDPSAANVLCLTDEQILKLGTVGIELEKAYGSPRDVEWAFYEGQLFLLQARPVTTLTNWTDFELLHEFDTAILTEQELHTIANVGEVMPGALTPLSQSFVINTLNKIISKHAFKTSEEPFTFINLGITHHCTLLNVTNSLLHELGEEMTMQQHVIDMSIFGHVVVDERLYEIGKTRHGVLSGYRKKKLLLKLIWLAMRSEKIIKEAVDLGRHFKIKLKDVETAAEMFERIKESMPHHEAVYDCHIRATNFSTFYQLIAMNVLASGITDLTNDHYYDIALLLSSCSNVVSVEIPRALEKIANIIRESGSAEKFVTIKPEDGVNWLRISCPKAADELDSFLERHGHRALREFDFGVDSWGMNPSIVIGMLQINCKGRAMDKNVENLDAEETVRKLVTPKNNTIRKILKFLVTRCRRSVANREATKSELIRILNKYRLAFRVLGKQMVSEGIIPDETLIAYFTLYELKQILNKTGDATLIQKAARRQRLHPQWNKIKLPELIYGVPKLDEDDSYVKNLLAQSDGKVRLNGTPVCPGDVVARACVITSLSEIDQLTAGDILITCSTDVGWSPYFPILAAVVTELGGLISHGAVVAREYGLPCIVGVQNATKVFKTGDTVLLSAKNGILELVKSAAEN